MGVVSSRLDYALPGLVLGGAPKSGTTSLFYWLSGSPEINPAKKKESNLLVDKNSWLWETKNEDLLEAGNIYQNLFRDCGDRRINLESCAVYLYMETALKFFSSFTEAKIVFIIRNPVERFISNYRYFFNVGDGGGLDFESYLKALLAGDEVVERNEQVNDALIHGDYHRYLSRWESLLGKDRIKILIFEEMIHDPISVVAELCEWVDIDKGFLRTLDFAPQNKSYVARWKMVHKFARSLSRVFPEGEMRNKVKNIYIKANGLRQENSYVGREMLEEYYMPRNRELEVLLDRKLDIWN